MMRYLILLLFLIPAWGQAQFAEQADLCQVFHLKNGSDTTTFLVYGNPADLQKKKPLFLFRQGSQPMPLIHHYADGFYMPVAPFRFQEYKDQYHFVMIAKPGVRLVADSVFLSQYQKAMREGDPSEDFLSKSYMRNNYRERYVEQCDEVINYLVQQPWVDKQKVVFCGGSEGFTIGADLIANKNRRITHAILYSGNSERRFEHLIHEQRERARKGDIKPEEAQQEIEKLYGLWEDIMANPLSTDQRYGDSFRAWHSFSVRNLDHLLKIQIPLLIAYGTADGASSANLDMLPIEFRVAGKQNLTFKPYVGYDHQFFKEENGAPVYKGDEVAKEWFQWLANIP